MISKEVNHNHCSIKINTQVKGSIQYLITSKDTGEVINDFKIEICAKSNFDLKSRINFAIEHTKLIASVFSYFRNHKVFSKQQLKSYIESKIPYNSEWIRSRQYGEVKSIKRIMDNHGINWSKEFQKSISAFVYNIGLNHEPFDQHEIQTLAKCFFDFMYPFVKGDWERAIWMIQDIMNSDRYSSSFITLHEYNKRNSLSKWKSVKYRKENNVVTIRLGNTHLVDNHRTLTSWKGGYFAV